MDQKKHVAYFIFFFIRHLWSVWGIIHIACECKMCSRDSCCALWCTSRPSRGIRRPHTCPSWRGAGDWDPEPNMFHQPLYYQLLQVNCLTIAICLATGLGSKTNGLIKERGSFRASALTASILCLHQLEQIGLFCQSLCFFSPPRIYTKQNIKKNYFQHHPRVCVQLSMVEEKHSNNDMLFAM